MQSGQFVLVQYTMNRQAIVLFTLGLGLYTMYKAKQAKQSKVVKNG